MKTKGERNPVEEIHLISLLLFLHSAPFSSPYCSKGYAGATGRAGPRQGQGARHAQRGQGHIRESAAAEHVVEPQDGHAGTKAVQGAQHGGGGQVTSLGLTALYHGVCVV